MMKTVVFKIFIFRKGIFNYLLTNHLWFILQNYFEFVFRREISTFCINFIFSFNFSLFLSFLIAVVIIASGSIILNVVLLTFKINKSEEGIVQKSVSTPIHCLKSSTLLETSSNESQSDLSHLDADIDSSSDAQSRSILSRIGLRRKNPKKHKKLWQTWHKVSRRRANPGSFTSDGNNEDWAKVPNSTSQFVEQPLSPVTSNNRDSSKADNVPSMTNKQRIVSEHTDELLEEISLELSTPEHRLTNNRISSVHLDNVFQEESVL